MILRRLGNKSKIASKIISYFPKHSIYFEPFFGAGGMFFNKPLSQYNYLNDIDSDVYNLFQVLINEPEMLYNLIELLPLHYDFMQYFKKVEQTDPIKKAASFLFRSNYSYMGKGDMLKFSCNNSKTLLLSNFKNTIDRLKNCQFHNTDFRVFLRSFAFRSEAEKQSTFIYCDPPYVGTADNYSHSFTSKDTDDLLSDENTRLQGNETSGSFNPGGAASGGTLAE